jgi:hypothetical protein
MLEGNLVAGAQKLVPGKPLVYGQSITDACMGWDETAELLAGLAKAVRIGTMIGWYRPNLRRGVVQFGAPPYLGSYSIPGRLRFGAITPRRGGGKSPYERSFRVALKVALKTYCSIFGLSAQGRNGCVRQNCELLREICVHAISANFRRNIAALLLSGAQSGFRDPSSAHLLGES